jgi:hypothetical protein
MDYWDCKCEITKPVHRRVRWNNECESPVHRGGPPFNPERIDQMNDIGLDGLWHSSKTAKNEATLFD